MRVCCMCVQTLNVLHLGSNQCLDRSSAVERDTPTIGLYSDCIALASVIFKLSVFHQWLHDGSFTILHVMERLKISRPGFLGVSPVLMSSIVVDGGS